jgi:bacterioferritin-associated ferredoxin
MLLRLILSIDPATGSRQRGGVMDPCGRSHSCPSDCGLRYVCHCLRITEDVLAQAFATQDIRTLKDIRRHTGAGDGCMACHRRLQGFLERHTVPGVLAQAVA